jgi:hypothetical protein
MAYKKSEVSTSKLTLSELSRIQPPKSKSTELSTMSSNRGFTTEEMTKASFTCLLQTTTSAKQPSKLKRCANAILDGTEPGVEAEECPGAGTRAIVPEEGAPPTYPADISRTMALNWQLCGEIDEFDNYEKFLRPEERPRGL